ncbi:MAG: stage V sporulation protein S, partial [Clostridia bacterium]|nr:stage V sporulation protein S [Clostridia bacterium]
NQAIKAVAIARGYVAPNGINLVMIPSFVEVLIDNEERTAIKITVAPR